MSTITSGSSATSDPVDARVTISRADGLEDATYLNQLLHHWFGWPYIAPGKLHFELFDVAGWEKEDNHYSPSAAWIARHDTQDGDVAIPIGAALVSIIDHDTCVDDLPEGRFDADALACERNAWFTFSAVDAAWRGQGIGTRFFEQRLAWAREQDAEIALANGWERYGAPSSRPLFERFGFQPVQTFEEGYIDGRDACPDCGVWPSDDRDCRCEMTLWARDLEEQDQ